MAFGRCGHCGHEPVAYDAPTCPRCGAKGPNPGVATRWAGKGGVVGMLLGSGAAGIAGLWTGEFEDGLLGLSFGLLGGFLLGAVIGMLAGSVAWLVGFDRDVARRGREAEVRRLADLDDMGVVVGLHKDIARRGDDAGSAAPHPEDTGIVPSATVSGLQGLQADVTKSARRAARLEDIKIVRNEGEFGKCRYCGYEPVAFDADRCPNCAAAKPNPGVVSRFADIGMVFGMLAGGVSGAILGFLALADQGIALGVIGFILAAVAGLLIGRVAGTVVGWFARL